MKKLIALVLTFVFALSLTAALADVVTIAVPNDPTNEGRALLLLQTAGVLKLKEGAGLEATKADIESTVEGLEIELTEVEAALVPEIKGDVDYAIINNNYALQAGLNPVKDSLLIEDADSPYVNVVSVKEGNENTPEAKALAAALTSQQVIDFIKTTYAGGEVVPTIGEPTDGYDPEVDYDALKGTTISVAGTPVPHVEVLKVAAEILAARDITLDIKEVTDYVTPNEFVENGDVFANYFAHQPYQDSFNAGNGTHLVTIAGVHVEPMALYGGKQTDLSALKISE